MGWGGGQGRGGRFGGELPRKRVGMRRRNCYRDTEEEKGDRLNRISNEEK